MSSERRKDICAEMSVVRDTGYKDGDWSGYINHQGF